MSFEKCSPNISVRISLLLGPKIPKQAKLSVISIKVVFLLKFSEICFLSCSLTDDPVTIRKELVSIQVTVKSATMPPFELSICV